MDYIKTKGENYEFRMLLYIITGKYTRHFLLMFFTAWTKLLPQEHEDAYLCVYNNSISISISLSTTFSSFVTSF